MKERRSNPGRRSSDLTMECVIDEIRDTNRRVDLVLVQLGALAVQIIRHDQEKTATLVEQLTKHEYLSKKS